MFQVKLTIMSLKLQMIRVKMYMVKDNGNCSKCIYNCTYNI